MNILYATTVRLPTEKAHGLQIMRMCEALAESGVAVELAAPRRRNPITEDPFAYYGIPRTFSVTSLFALDTVGFGALGFWFHRISFAWSVLRFVRAKRPERAYTRDEIVAWILSLARVPYVFEVHEGRWNIFMRRAATRATAVVVITRALSDFLETHGISRERLIVAPDGIPEEWLRQGIAKEDARRKTGLSGRIALYTGHLYGWKGADTLARAARRLVAVQFVFLGGTDEDIKRFRASYGPIPNIAIIGRKKHGEIPAYLSAADVLVLPNSGGSDLSRLYTSPLKLFEYMSASRPIVASDLPSIREVLDEETAYFFIPDDPNDLARAIALALSDPLSAAKARAAHRRVGRYTWTKRAARILALIRAR